MKKFKLLRLLSLLLVFCLLATVLLTACDSDKDDDDDDDGKTEKTDKAASGRNEFISDIGGVSETYEGAVSELTYETAEEAASAYISNEVVGDNAYAENVVAESKGELASADVDKLNLPEELKEGITAVEKFEVSYTLAGEARVAQMSSAMDNDSSYKVIVYVIRYGIEWKYFTPMPVKGDTITKSYYESVFNEEKYENCTFVNVSSVKVTSSAGGQSMSYQATITQTIKRADGKIYFEQTVVGDNEMISQMGVGISRYLCGYIEETDNGKVTYIKNSENGVWQEGYLTNNVNPFGGQEDVDYSYFSKTDFGFALKGENARQYYRQAASGGALLDDAKLDLYAEYYVSGGVLSGMRMEYSAEISQKIGGSTVSSVTEGLNKMSCTDYGTTVVEKPF